jgi:thiol-disulfide isomerase/thioredoxin
MTIRMTLAFLICLAATSVLGAPQAKVARDPQVIDAAGFQKLLEKYRGKPLLVTFWATWCEPCRDEYPMLNELAKQYEPKGLRVVGINLDDDGDLILTRRFIARYKPVFLNYRKKGGRGSSDFERKVWSGWNGSLPVAFLYASDGRQVGQFLGATNREVYEAAVRPLLPTNNAAASAR